MQKVIRNEETIVVPSRFVRAARLSLAASAASLLLLAALHVLRPDMDPSWHMVSQYAIGRYGWVQGMVFITLAVSCLSLFAALRNQAATRGGKIGLGFLVAAAAGSLMAAVFNWEHPLHGLASIIGVPGLSTAALLISFSLRRSPAWAPIRQRLLWLGLLPWISFILMLGALFLTVPPSGEFEPGVLVGWPNRLLLLAWYAWLMAVAWQANKVHSADHDSQS